jgi:hypothetical protein
MNGTDLHLNRFNYLVKGAKKGCAAYGSGQGQGQGLAWPEILTLPHGDLQIEEGFASHSYM